MTRQGIVVLISGGGTNLQALIDAASVGQLVQPIKAVISNNLDAGGLDRARKAGIPAVALDHRVFSSRHSYDTALAELIDRFDPKLVALAGFMRILSEQFVSHFQGRMINIHPALLPEFKGLNTHQRALDAGRKTHGATVHFVTPDLDDGPNIIQASLNINETDTAEVLASRVLRLEHQIYPEAVALFLDDRLQMIEQGCLLDGKLLPPTGILR